MWVINGIMAIKIASARTCAGLTQEALGDQVGVSQQMIKMYEDNKRLIPAARLKKIAEATNTPLSFFFDAEGWKRVISLKNSKIIDRIASAVERIEDPKRRKLFLELLENIAGDENA